MDDPADDLMNAIAKAIAAAPETAPWSQRIVLGCWNVSSSQPTDLHLSNLRTNVRSQATYLEAARRILPAFPLALITFSLLYAKHFFPIPDIGINMFQKVLVGLSGSSFMRKAQNDGHPMFVWTVNDEKSMEWCIKKNMPPKGKGGGAQTQTQGARLLDGVMTDDPKLFLEICERWEDELDGKVAPKKRGLVRRVRDAGTTLREFLVFRAATIFFYVMFRFVFKKKRLDLPKETRLREIMTGKPVS